MFDSIARRYDLLNHLLSMNIDRRWRARVVKMILRQSPESVLDVATGTGDLAIAVGRALPAAALTGVDLSPRMLRIGQEKVAARFPGREFPMLEGDAERLPFADASFGAVTCGFGVRNFENLPRGLAEMYRVLRPGGRVYILEFRCLRSAMPWADCTGSISGISCRGSDGSYRKTRGPTPTCRNPSESSPTGNGSARCCPRRVSPRRNRKC